MENRKPNGYDYKLKSKIKYQIPQVFDQNDILKIKMKSKPKIFDSRYS
jgi:hypothetical protein